MISRSLRRIEGQLDVITIISLILGILIFARLKRALINAPGLYGPAIVSLVELMRNLYNREQEARGQLKHNNNTINTGKKDEKDEEVFHDIPEAPPEK